MITSHAYIPPFSFNRDTSVPCQHKHSRGLSIPSCLCEDKLYNSTRFLPLVLSSQHKHQLSSLSARFSRPTPSCRPSVLLTSSLGRSAALKEALNSTLQKKNPCYLQVLNSVLHHCTSARTHEAAHTSSALLPRALHCQVGIWARLVRGLTWQSARCH